MAFESFSRTLKNTPTPYQTLMDTKNKPTWIRGVWIGKDHSDHDLLFTGGGRILRAKAVRQTQTGDLWDAEFLSSIQIGPEDLLKTYTHSTVRIPPGLPPAAFPIAEGVETADEATSDPPSDSRRGERMQDTPFLPSPLRL